MSKRLNAHKAAPEAMKPMVALSQSIDASGLDKRLLELVRMRASQINGCAYCIHLHAHEARSQGEHDDRLLLLDAWRESSAFSPRERAALAWTEALTLIADGPVEDELYDEALAEFGEEELVKLTLAIVVINGWNRFAIPFEYPHPTVPAG